MLLNMLNDLAEAMKALDGKKLRFQTPDLQLQIQDEDLTYV